MQVVVAPGANVVTGQVTEPAFGSLTATEWMVVVPVLRTRNDHWIRSPRSVWPSTFRSMTEADLVTDSPETWSMGVSADDGGETTGPPWGSAAEAVAVFETTPASTSAWVMT